MAELPRKFLQQLKQCVDPKQILSDSADRWVYGYDNSRQHALPDLVVFAATHDQVRDIVRLCHEFRIPLIARGRGTNTAGGTVPEQGGVVLSLERMNRILELDPANRLLRTETGATNQAVQEAAAAAHFFWPPDPTSAEYCTIGGNLGMNAAGPHALKYGSTRENVLGLRAVTGNGKELRLGVLTTKGVVGYDLTRLLIGSEGTLAIITEATLKLTPLPQARRTLQAIYNDIQAAAAAVAAIMAQAATPSALEFMDPAAIAIVREYSDTPVPTDAQAVLIMEVDGNDASLAQAIDAIQQAANNAGLLTFQAATDEVSAQQLWAMRKALSPALRKLAPNKLNEDVVVPVSHIPELIQGLAVLSQEFAIPIVNFGHAGNGNIHVNLLYDTQDPQQEHNARPCLERVFDLVLRLGGTLSGEHGIGREKNAYIGREIDPVSMDLMWRIKQQFDPHGILNPGKLFPPGYRGDAKSSD